MDFNIVAGDIGRKIQLMIEWTILGLNRYKKINLPWKAIHVVAGLTNDNYRRLYDEFCSLKQYFSIVVSVLNQSNANDSRNFLKLIKYSNVAMNIGSTNYNDEDDDVECASLIFISDRTLESPILWIAQYFRS